MEEGPKLISKKRRTPSFSPSHPFMGIFTRSKSQIYLHRNRSGRARSDSIRQRKHHYNLQSSLVVFQSNNRRTRRGRRRSVRDLTPNFAGTDEWSCLLIKDLRTRRVFSPASMGDDECGLCIDKKERKGSERCEDVPNSESVNDMRVGEKNEIKRSDGDGETSDEERMQATPPDAEIFGSRYENGDKKLEFPSPKPWIGGGNHKEGFEDSIDKKNGNYPFNKPWCRVKVFKAPGSFSHRRLLPYLTDTGKDDSCATRKCNVSNIENQQISVNESNAQRCSNGERADNSGTLSQAAPVFANGHNSNLSSVTRMTDSLMLYRSQKNPCIRGCCSKSLPKKICLMPLVNRQMGIESAGKDEPNISSCVKPMDSEETEREDGEYHWNIPDANYTGHNLSLIVEKHQLGGDNDVGQESGDTTQIKTGDLKAFDTGDPCNATKPHYVSHNLVDAEVFSRKKGNGNGDVLEKINVSNESIQMMPPDASISQTPEAYEYMDKRTRCVLQTADRVTEKPLNASIDRNNSCFSNRRVDSKSKSKLGLNPSSQLKLFKTSSSFSYRRLLPYLKNIIKENSGALGNEQCPKIEKSAEENPVSPTLTCDLHETSTEKFNSKSHHMKHETSNSIGSEEQNLQVEGAISDEDGLLENAPEIVQSIHGSSSPTMPLCLATPKSFYRNGLNLVQCKLSVDSKGGCTTSVVKFNSCMKPIEAGSMSQVSPKLEASNPLIIPPCGSKKGILKRNPRGCRGICTCLNCASFRLNAERAFEFSQNQMQDAEEVALDLIKKLSDLRNMLEKSALATDDCGVVSINQIQVKEACRKASEAEELAKSRLSQMNYDLGIHCRITCGERPRVRFSNTVEERLIP